MPSPTCRRTRGRRSRASIPRAGRRCGPRRPGCSTPSSGPSSADTEVAETRARLTGAMAGGIDDAGADARSRADRPARRPELVVQRGPDVDGTRASAAEAVAADPGEDPQGEVIARSGDVIDASGHREDRRARASATRAPTSRASVAGCCSPCLVVGLLLAWIWRFRPGLWHRNNVLILIGSLLVAATIALKATAGRPTLPYLPADRRRRDAAGGPPRRRRSRPIVIAIVALSAGP